ncbi:SAM-dependent methyltransferase [uncultured Treponema sp.]|uniref:class I SAM-dependent methyltransferase n=1 Tax=uncultured Treponema sp. TaxID=162155 RepID=UPI00258A26BF|nr:SAM-dependent methyltransferase [uncultured Treponema sp.]
MILSAVFSKPSKTCQEIFGKPYIKIRIWKNPSPSAKKQNKFQAEFFTEKQAFQKSFTAEQAREFIEKHAGTAFKNCIVKTDTEEITTMANKKGEIKVFRKAAKNFSTEQKFSNNFNRIKNYILQEGNPVPFLIELGVMTKDGKVVAQKYDKFRQINRFLEFINDIIESIEKLNGASYTQENPLRIVDFGSGKSYLTFAVYYFLTELKKIPVYITGLDLKEDVIKNCDSLAKKLGCKNLEFKIGNIADYSSEKNPDIIITLHACDTATDFALDYAVKHNAKAILSVPCCQHEINSQLEKQKIKSESPFASIERFGILRERFAAIATDAIRAELLEQCGYTVQVLEFIDMSHTPKNILIRAVKKQSDNFKNKESKIRIKSLLDELYCNQTLEKLLSKESKL